MNVLASLISKSSIAIFILSMFKSSCKWRKSLVPMGITKTIHYMHEFVCLNLAIPIVNVKFNRKFFNKFISNTLNMVHIILKTWQDQRVQPEFGVAIGSASQ